MVHCDDSPMSKHFKNCCNGTCSILIIMHTQEVVAIPTTIVPTAAIVTIVISTFGIFVMLPTYCSQVGAKCCNPPIHLSVPLAQQRCSLGLWILQSTCWKSNLLVGVHDQKWLKQQQRQSWSCHCWWLWEIWHRALAQRLSFVYVGVQCSKLCIYWLQMN